MTNNPQNCAGKTSTWDKHHEGHSGYLAVNIANTNLAGWLSSAKPDIVMFMLGTNDVRTYGTADIIAAYTKMVGLMRGSNKGMKIIVRFSNFPSFLPPFPKTRPSISFYPTLTLSHSLTRIRILTPHLDLDLETRLGLSQNVKEKNIDVDIDKQVDLVIPFPSSDAKIKSLNAAIPAWAAAQNTSASPIYIADCNTGYNGQSMLRDGVHPNAAGDKLIAERLTPVLVDVVKRSLGIVA